MYRDKREDEDTEEQSVRKCDDQDWIPHTLLGPGGDTI